MFANHWKDWRIRPYAGPQELAVKGTTTVVMFGKLETWEIFMPTAAFTTFTSSRNPEATIVFWNILLWL